MEGFTNLSDLESELTNGGGLVAAACVVVGGSIATFGVCFAVGYGLAKWLG